MLYELSLRKIHLPFTFIALLVGLQISSYFIYLYGKHHKEQLEYNRILLAYGILYGAGILGVFIRTLNTHYLDPSNITVNSNLMLISHVIISLGTLIFIVIFSTDALEKIINPIISRFIFVIDLIISSLLIIIHEFEFVFLLINISLFIGGAYMLTIQYRLIKLTHGDIKHRLVYITIGDIIMLLGILMQAEEILAVFSPMMQEMLLTASSPFIITGLSAIFLGVFNFPAFLEFDWKAHLIKIFIIDRTQMKLLYTYDVKSDEKEESIPFSRELLISNRDKIFFSKGIVGIGDIMSQLTNSSTKTLDKIRQGESYIILEHSDAPFSFVSYGVLVTKDMQSYHFLLKSIRKEFEEIYGSLLKEIELLDAFDVDVFSSFDYVLEENIF